MPRSNLEQLIATAELLGPLLPDLVFVGGAATGLLVTDEGAGAPLYRPVQRDTVLDVMHLDRKILGFSN